jgi:DNA-directed RNA polymerase subunit L
LLNIFKIDEEKVKEITESMTESEKITFNTQENERVYIRNENGEPNVYQFHIESNGFYEPLIIFNLGINLLINKLNTIKSEIRNKKSKKVISLENTDNPDFYDFLIDGENETIGNLLSTYITYDSNVFYCGYVIEHPLKKNIILRVKLNIDNTEENSIIIIEQNIDIIINILNKIINEMK